MHVETRREPQHAIAHRDGGSDKQTGFAGRGQDMPYGGDFLDPRLDFFTQTIHDVNGIVRADAHRHGGGQGVGNIQPHAGPAHHTKVGQHRKQQRREHQ